MTEVTNSSQSQENKISEKEINFRKQEAMFQRMLAEKDARIAEIQSQAQQKLEQPQEEDDEPYVDHKKLDKKLSIFEKKMEEKIERKAEEKARSLFGKEKQDNWIRSNPDFYDVMQYAEKFAQHDPDLAETILEMPEGFERQKLVYKNIKALNLHKPAVKEPSIQDKVDANRRSPYYQPSGVATAPYATVGDFSATGQAQAYKKMQELKSKLRI